LEEHPVRYAIVHPGSDAALDIAWHERAKSRTVQESNAAYDALAQSLDVDLRVDHPAMIRFFEEFGLDGLSRVSGCSIDSLVKPRTLKQKARAFLKWRLSQSTRPKL
jgi:hypothetical protein